MTQNRTEHLYFDGPSYFAALIEDIDHAKVHIDLESYIFELDETGQRVLKALIKASLRGVRVRLLVDGFGSFNTISKLTERLRDTPVQFRVYKPIFIGGVLAAIKAFRKLWRRNHRKTCLIDERTAWIGSFNISDVHTKKIKGQEAWRDSAICIRLPDLQLLTVAFERAWAGYFQHRRFGRKFANKVNDHKHFLLNYTNSVRRKRNRALTTRISKARERVWVTTPYFSPDYSILKALRTAARRGADVRLLLPEKPDIMIVRWLNSVFYRGFYRSGLKIYLYKSAVLHAKTILADDWGIVGSSNLNHRSLLQDLEVDAVVTQKSPLKELEAQFIRDLEVSDRILVRDPKKDGFLARVLARIVIWLRRWT